MSNELYEQMKVLREKFNFDPGRVLEIGSLNINGSVRDLFEDASEYIGTDMMAGLDVDEVVNAHDLKQWWMDKGFKRFDTILCLEMLEHDDKFWITVANMNLLLKPGGTLIVSTPTFGFPIHRHPKDYYRYGEDAYREIIFAGHDIKYFAEFKHKGVNPGIICGGTKHEE